LRGGGFPLEEESASLIVKLEAFLRGAGLRNNETRFTAEWLPKPETVRESVGPDETGEMARDIVHRRVRKVRPASPPSHLPEV